MTAIILINTNARIGEYANLNGARRAIKRRVIGRLTKNEVVKTYKLWTTIETWTDELNGVKTSYAIVTNE